MDGAAGGLTTIVRVAVAPGLSVPILRDDIVDKRGAFQSRHPAAQSPGWQRSRR